MALCQDCLAEVGGDVKPVYRGLRGLKSKEETDEVCDRCGNRV